MRKRERKRAIDIVNEERKPSKKLMKASCILNSNFNLQVTCLSLAWTISFNWHTLRPFVSIGPYVVEMLEKVTLCFHWWSLCLAFRFNRQPQFTWSKCVCVSVVDDHGSIVGYFVPLNHHQYKGWPRFVTWLDSWVWVCPQKCLAVIGWPSEFSLCVCVERSQFELLLSLSSSCEGKKKEKSARVSETGIC